MGIEINLMKNYPRTKRDPKARAESKTEEDRSIARQFDKDFFDGNRKYGYGGYNYNSRFWQPVVPDFINHSFLVFHAIYDNDQYHAQQANNKRTNTKSNIP